MSKRLLRQMAVLLGIAALAVGMSGYASSQRGTSHSGDMSFVFLTSYKVHITKQVNYGETPLGTRVDVYFEGELTGDRLSGAMQGIDYVTIRPDGITEISPRASIQTGDGAFISVQISGYEFPDGTIKDSFVRFLTGNKRYEWLNDKVVFGEGRLLSGTEFEINYYYLP